MVDSRQYDDQPAPYLTRIYGGSATGSGAFQFTSPTYQANENDLEANIVVRRVGGTSGTNADGSGNVFVQFSTSPGTATPNVNYTTVVTNVFFPPGEVLETVAVLSSWMSHVITTNLTVNMALSNPSALTGLGDQTNAVLTIANTDSSISFASASYQVAKNTPTGLANINIVRTGGTTGGCTVDFATTTNGTAVIGTDYAPTNMTVTFNPGDSVKTVADCHYQQQPAGRRPDRDDGFEQHREIQLWSVPSSATLTIQDTVFAPGQLCFASTNFLPQVKTIRHATIIRSSARTALPEPCRSSSTFDSRAQRFPGINYIFRKQ